MCSHSGAQTRAVAGASGEPVCFKPVEPAVGFAHVIEIQFKRIPHHAAVKLLPHQRLIMTNRTTFRTGLFSALLFAMIFVGNRESSAQIENSGFPVLQMEPSARSAAMAGSSTAVSESGAGALFLNPALITPDVDGRIEFSWLNHLSDINAGWIAYGKDMDSLGTFVAGLRYLSFGSFDERNDIGEKTGTFSAADVSLTLGGSRAWTNKVRYGAALSISHSSLASNGANALSTEAGLVYSDEASRQSIGVSLHHLGVVVSSIGERSDKLPTDLRIGYTRRLAHLPLLVSVTGYRLNKMDGGPDGTGAIGKILYHTRLAGEFQFSESFRVRFGYDHRRHDELRVNSRLDLAGFSTGVGIKISRFAFDYAFNSWSSLGGLHRITIASSL